MRRGQGGLNRTSCRRLAGAGACEQGKEFSDRPPGLLPFELKAIVAPSLTWLRRRPGVAREGQRLKAMAFRGSRGCSHMKDYHDFWK